MDFDNSDTFNERVRVGDRPRNVRYREKSLVETQDRIHFDEIKYLEETFCDHENWTRELRPQYRLEVRFSGDGGTIRASKRDNLIFYDIESDPEGLEKNACLALAPGLQEFYSESSNGMSFQAESPSEIKEVAGLLTSLDTILGYSPDYE